ncbi:MAG: hypothetical protein GYB21_06110 [Oceanospirillales bacterium]|nr:hypothetical protein [Oceanospirillales bacterium]
MDASTQTQTRPVWDIFIRLFHWTLAGTIVFAWWSAEQGGNWMTAHMLAGYTILSLILFRLIWGFIGTPYARFASFVKAPGHTLQYFKTAMRREEPHYTGHNPLGGWMVIALILLCTLQATSGLFATDDIFTEGPLSSWVSSGTASLMTAIHEANFNLLLGAIFLHLAGVIYHQRFKGEPLVQGMIHGRKPVSGGYSDVRTPVLLGLIVIIPALGLFLLLRSLG